MSDQYGSLTDDDMETIGAGGVATRAQDADERDAGGPNDDADEQDADGTDQGDADSTDARDS